MTLLIGSMQCAEVSQVNTEYYVLLKNEVAYKINIRAQT